MARTPTKPNQSPRDVYYSIGADQTKNLKEKIAEVHGADSEVMKAVDELDHYVADPETRNSSLYWRFYKRVKSRMWALYPYAGNIVRTSMTREFIDDLFNGGYIRTLQFMSAQCAAAYLSFAREYANGYFRNEDQIC